MFTTRLETLVPTTTGNSDNRWGLCLALPLSIFVYLQAKEQGRSSQEPLASKRKVVSVRKLVQKQPAPVPAPQPQQSRFANFQPRAPTAPTAPAAPAAPARQPSRQPARQAARQPVRQTQPVARQHVRQQQQQILQPQQPAAPAYQSDPRFTGGISFMKYFLFLPLPTLRTDLTNVCRTETAVPDLGPGVQLPEQLRRELLRLYLPAVRHDGQGGQLQLLRHLLILAMSSLLTTQST